jgi:hypothetical protein
MLSISKGSSKRSSLNSIEHMMMNLRSLIKLSLAKIKSSKKFMRIWTPGTNFVK